MFNKGSLRLSLAACTLAAALGASSSVEAATPVGPAAVVKGTNGGSVAVTVRLLDTDELRVCFEGSGLAESVAKWENAGESGRNRRSVYAGEGCQRFKHDFAAGSIVRIRACFADPRRPKKLYCGSWKSATAE